MAGDRILEQVHVAPDLVDGAIGGWCHGLLCPAEAVVVVFLVFFLVMHRAAAGHEDGCEQAQQKGRMSHSGSIPITCSGRRTAASGRRSARPWNSSRRRAG